MGGLSQTDGKSCMTCLPDFLLYVVVAEGLEKAYSGGELPYHFADTPSALQPADSSNKKRHPPTLKPIDDDTVFDPIANVAVPEFGQAPGHGPAGSEGVAKDENVGQQAGDDQLSDTNEEENGQPAETDHLDDTTDYAEEEEEPQVAVLESPADSWNTKSAHISAMDPLPSSSVPSQSGDYSWSVDLLGRLNLNSASAGGASDRQSARQSDHQPTTPSSVAAVGSAPSTTLSEFSAVGRNSSGRNAHQGSSASKGHANSGDRSDKRTRRGNNSNNRYKA